MTEPVLSENFWNYVRASKKLLVARISKTATEKQEDQFADESESLWALLTNEETRVMNAMATENRLWLQWVNAGYLDDKKALDDLKLQFDRARKYQGIEGWACPLCVYRGGVFISNCTFHAREKQQDERIEELEAKLKAREVKDITDNLERGRKRLANAVDVSNPEKLAKLEARVAKMRSALEICFDYVSDKIRASAPMSPPVVLLRLDREILGALEND